MPDITQPEKVVDRKASRAIRLLISFNSNSIVSFNVQSPNIL